MMEERETANFPAPEVLLPCINSFNHFQRNNSQAICNEQASGKNRASSPHGEATAHGLLISLLSFGTGFGHVSDYKMKF